jgi:hypothetical protein
MISQDSSTEGSLTKSFWSGQIKWGFLSSFGW